MQFLTLHFWLHNRQLIADRVGGVWINKNSPVEEGKGTVATYDWLRTVLVGNCSNRQ
jgi:hypothetical protein